MKFRSASIVMVAALLLSSLPLLGQSEDKSDEAKSPHRAAVSGAADRHGPASEIEGCKFCAKIEIYQPVYCRVSFLQDFCRMTPPETGFCDPSSCSEWIDWVPKEIGERRQTIGATTSVGAWLTVDHQASTSMSMWLNQRLNVPAGYVGPAGSYFTPYSFNVEGTSSASESYSTQTWTTTINNHEVEYQVKIWTCSQSGSYCSLDTDVEP